MGFVLYASSANDIGVCCACTEDRCTGGNERCGGGERAELGTRCEEMGAGKTRDEGEERREGRYISREKRSVNTTDLVLAGGQI